MSGCCPPGGDLPGAYDSVFNERFARHVARRYEKKGLTRTQRRMVEFLAERGIDGSTVLEVGGGVGEMQIELLRLGASRATNVEIATTYESEALRLIELNGLAGRVDRRHADIATAPDQVDPADIVVLHRVVCCYPDYERLLTAAGSHAGRLLVFSHPPRNLASRIWMTVQNLTLRVLGRDFQAFTHPPGRMLDVLAAQGLAPVYRHKGMVWQVAGLTR